MEMDISALKHRRCDFLKTKGLFVASLMFVSWISCGVVVGREKAAEKLSAGTKKQSGVTVLKRDKCDNGYRLYSSRATEVAHIIDLDGREVHRWAYPQGKTWHYAEMLPNGHLLAIIKDIMILELDWDSNLVWNRRMRAHHDFFRLPNGNTLVVDRRNLKNPWTPSGKLTCDIIVELTPGRARGPYNSTLCEILGLAAYQYC